ncbi:MAG TPA: mannose-1-phosphate guanylyltransferase [Blastocatellia bacterium]|jgi:mannose-1-phosphate guanylyltransferase|nr:mannose-1-phosphate guanylyltransferase [Blastocatellia bacterium]
MFAVIMAGGSGTRFWPASRERLPKQFLAITGDRTMLEQTIARAECFAAPGRISVVVGRVHADLTKRVLSGKQVEILVEPRGRNTAACVGLAALHVKRIAAGGVAEDEPMVVLPADHFIADVESFTRTIRAAAEIARGGAIVTLGVAPDRPETGYGYIHIGAESGKSSAQPYFRVRRFVEKPDYQTALGYLSSGDYLWNSGVFIFTARTILQEIEACMPALHEGLAKIERAIDTPDYDAAVERAYDNLHSVSIDYGVMEKTSKPIYVLKADFGWSDVGSWQALYELRRAECDEQGNLSLGDSTIIEAKRNLIFSTTGRNVALLGVEDLVIVDTPDAVMVARLDSSQDVKRFADQRRER